MSLINKMLQDLEKRQGSSGENEPISGEVRSAPVDSSSRTILMVSVLLAAVLAIAAVWMFMQPRAAQPVVAVISPPPVVRVAAIPAPPAPAPAPIVPKAPEDAVVQAPDVLVAKAPEVTPVKAPEVMSKAVALAAAKAPPTPAPLKIEPFAPARDEGKIGATVPPVIKRPSKTAAEDPTGVAPAEKPEVKTVVAAEGRPQKSVSPQQLSENLYKQVDLVRKDMCLNFGAFITESSGHLSEYLPYYRKSEAGRAYLRRSYEGGTRFYASN